MNNDVQTIEFLKNETTILKIFADKPQNEDSIYQKLFETLDVIIKGQH